MSLRPIALALALAAATGTAGRPALAQSAPAPAACAPYRELAETLRRRFGETLRLSAEENRGFALEFFADASGGWTLVMRRGGQACAVAAGTSWRAEPQGAF